MKTSGRLNMKKKKQEDVAEAQLDAAIPAINPQADRSDPFLYLLNATSSRIKQELHTVFQKKPKVLKKCETNCDKMQTIYFSWEHNMKEAREGLRKMDSFYSLTSVSPGMQKNISDFNETINRGRENMGEAKRSWNNKCKTIYRGLDPKGKYRENLMESIDEATGSLLKGCREIYNIAKNNHDSMRNACHKVLVEYNRSAHNAPAKIKKTLPCKSFPISPKTYETFIGKCPKW